MENQNENENFESIVEAYTETDQKIHEEAVKENENYHFYNKTVSFLPNGIFGFLFLGLVVWLIIRAVRNRR